MADDPGLTAERTALTELPASTRSTPAPSVEPACLVQIVGDTIGKRVPLLDADVVIGRSSEADLQLEIEDVSRTHAIVSRTSHGFVLRDHGSTNGTFVNEQPIRERALRDGDQIRIGRAMLKFLTSSNVEAQYHEEMYRLMTLDALTEVHNRRHFQETIEREFARSRRYDHPFALILIDVDHFKQVNDLRGHQAGDLVLRRIGAILRRKVRTNDLAARIGGEEFALILPETTASGARSLAEKLRKMVETERYEHDGEAFRVTASLGVAVYARDVADAAALVKLADERLYRAKRTGRNRVCC
ncbi:MAG: GGDEF domain-containing protein [Polyangiales bacterium]